MEAVEKSRMQESQHTSEGCSKTGCNSSVGPNIKPPSTFGNFLKREQEERRRERDDSGD